MTWAVAVHGGAGAIASMPESRERAARAGLTAALRAAVEVLSKGGPALDAVAAAVVVLEDDPLFNAGRGSVLTSTGAIEMDAAVMDGRDRRAGAVTGVRTVRHPVLLARRVLEDTAHVLISGDGAEALAGELGVERVDPAWLRTDERVAQLQRARQTGGVHLDHGGQGLGTVGAVACDVDGHVAAATSTGGMVNKRPGRVGDTPILGAGTWAWSRTCAVSGTGHGESFLRATVGARISAWMEMGGLTLQQAADRVVHEELAEIGGTGGTGGVIAVDAAGRLALPFNTRGMYRGFATEEGLQVAIW